MSVNKIICVFCMCIPFYSANGLEVSAPLEMGHFSATKQPIMAPVVSQGLRVLDLVKRVLVDSWVFSQKDGYTSKEMSVIRQLSESIVHSISAEKKLFRSELDFSYRLFYEMRGNMEGAGRAVSSRFFASGFINERNPRDFFNFLANNIDYANVQLSTFDSKGQEFPISFSSAVKHITISGESPQISEAKREKKELIIVSYPFITPVRAGVQKVGSGRCSFYNAEEIRFFVVKEGQQLRITMFPSQWSLKENRLIRGI